MHIVVDPPAGTGLGDEEVFGPILPVHSYESLDAAIAKVNEGERPLGLYVFTVRRRGGRRRPRPHLLRRRLHQRLRPAGSAPSLGFGGVGQSGTGRHHGIDGFREFTNPRGVFHRGENDLCALFYPPFNERQQELVDSALEG